MILDESQLSTQTNWRKTHVLLSQCAVVAKWLSHLVCDVAPFRHPFRGAAELIFILTCFPCSVQRIFIRVEITTDTLLGLVMVDPDPVVDFCEDIE